MDWRSRHRIRLEICADESRLEHFTCKLFAFYKRQLAWQNNLLKKNKSIHTKGSTRRHSSACLHLQPQRHSQVLAPHHIAHLSLLLPTTRFRVSVSSHHHPTTHFCSFWHTISQSLYMQINFRILVHGVGLGSWSLLLFKAFFTFVIGLVGLKLFKGLNTSYGNSYSSSR